MSKLSEVSKIRNGLMYRLKGVSANLKSIINSKEKPLISSEVSLIEEAIYKLKTIEQTRARSWSTYKITNKL